MIVFLIGFVFGIVLSVCILFYFSGSYTRNCLECELPVFSYNEPLSCNWVNLVIERFYEMCVRSRSTYQIAQFIAELLSNDQDSNSKFFLRDFYMNTIPLKIIDFRLIPSSFGDYIQVNVCFEPSLIIDAHVVHKFNSLSSPISVDCDINLQRIYGGLNVLVPSHGGAIVVSFSDDTQIDFDLGAQIGSFSIQTENLGYLKKPLKSLIHKMIRSTKIIVDLNKKKVNQSSKRISLFKIKCNLYQI